MARDAAGPARGPRGAGARRAAGRPDRHPAGLPAARPDLAGADDVTGPGLLSRRRHGARQDDHPDRSAPVPAERARGGGTDARGLPASLMGNWQREIERFAPGTPVRRFHGARRSLDDLAGDGFVLTTYGTMRLDAERLAA